MGPRAPDSRQRGVEYLLVKVEVTVIQRFLQLSIEAPDSRERGVEYLLAKEEVMVRPCDRHWYPFVSPKEPDSRQRGVEYLLGPQKEVKDLVMSRRGAAESRSFPPS